MYDWNGSVRSLNVGLPDDIARLQPDGLPFAPSPDDPLSRTRAFVKVQDGCNNKCTFCIVTALRGDSRSRRQAAIRHAASAAASARRSAT